MRLTTISVTNKKGGSRSFALHGRARGPSRNGVISHAPAASTTDRMKTRFSITEMACEISVQDDRSDRKDKNFLMRKRG